MGQKINPIGFRLAVNRNWSSRWYASNRTFAPMLADDIKVRAYLKKKLSHASVGRVVIERPAKDARITIYSARPGVVIGKKGEEIEALKVELRRLMGVQQVHVSIEEIRKPEIDAQLIADSIAQQLEKRIMFRRAMKRAMQNAMRLGAQGIKIMSSGRLNGIEIARTEWYREGRVPLHTLRADIDYGFGEAKTTYGVIGIKVWVYKGDVMPKTETPAALGTVLVIPAEEPAPAKRAKKPAPKAAPRRAPAKDKTEAEAEAKKPVRARAAKKEEGDAAAKPKTTVKRTRKPAAKEGETGGEEGNKE
ncbi:MAG TPA: 30S ribosomal protein S3 [Burkholderiales bacterium]|nr:30S ribosomal protein S3 [Burkholderiales bacterium]